MGKSVEPARGMCGDTALVWMIRIAPVMSVEMRTSRRLATTRFAANPVRPVHSADCPGNQLGHCLIGGHRCYDSADCDVIACVNGGCLIGANCAPDEGLTCRDMPQ